MILAASLLTGTCAYLLAGALTGSMPALSLPSIRRPPVSRAQTWLTQAGVDATPRQFWLGSAALGALGFVLVVALTATPAVAVVPAAALAALPRAWFARERSRRLRALQEHWPDGIRDLLASISAGMSLNQAIVHLAEHGPAPLREAFGHYPTLARVVGVVPALETVKEELADPTSDRVIEVLVLAHERGGHLLEDILRDLAAATTKDVRAQEEIATAQLEQRINARAVFVLPWLVLLALTARAGPFRSFYGSAAGVGVVAVAGLLSAVGMWWVSRLAREPTEDRVLGSAAPTTERRGEAHP